MTAKATVADLPQIAVAIGVANRDMVVIGKGAREKTYVFDMLSIADPGSRGSTPDVVVRIGEGPGAWILVSEVIVREGFTLFTLGSSPAGGEAPPVMQALFGGVPGSFHFSSASDPRWDGGGRSDHISVTGGPPAEAAAYVNGKHAALGAVPADLTYSCCKD